MNNPNDPVVHRTETHTFAARPPQTPAATHSEPYIPPALAKALYETRSKGMLVNGKAIPANDPTQRAIDAAVNKVMATQPKSPHQQLAEVQARLAISELPIQSNIADVIKAAEAQPQTQTKQPQNNPRTVQMPSNTRPNSDTEGTSLALPSRFVFYDFKDVYVTPFKGKHLAKLARAHTENSLAMMVEVVSSVLTSTYPVDNIAFHLTMPDFYFILYWLRRNSFTKSTYTHSTKCRNEAHLIRVAKGELPKESLDIVEIIRDSTLVTKELEVLPDLPDLDDPNIILQVNLMSDVVDLLANPKFTDAEWAYKAQVAACFNYANYFVEGVAVKPILDQKIEIADEFTANDSAAVNAFEEAVNDYGVTEKIKVKCTGCGASMETTVSIGAQDFLSVK